MIYVVVAEGISEGGVSQFSLLYSKVIGYEK